MNTNTTLSKQVDEMIENSQNTAALNEKYKIQAMEQAHSILRKSIHKKENQTSLSWLLQSLTTLCSSTEVTPKKHTFQFENSRSAAKFNTKLIKLADYKLENCIRKQKNTILSAGSEFRNIQNLQKLFKYHENWVEIKNIITKGCEYNMINEPDEKTRLSDLLAMIERGNHKSSKSDENFPALQKAFDKEVKRGWLLPITVESLTKIKGLSIIPLGIATQFTVNESGDRVIKRRVTHDASFPAPSGLAVNNMVQEALLQDCIYGKCLLRVLHSIHQMRWDFKNKRILMSKYDMDAAYRRLHTAVKHSLQCVTIVGSIAYIPLRLPFGVSPGPSLYSTISEAIFDVVNDLLLEKDWDRGSLHSPYEQILPPPIRSGDDQALSPVNELAVHVPSRKSFADGYIDDCLTVAVDVDDEVQRSQEALPLVVHCTFRPISPDEPIHRDDNLSYRKLQGEGAPNEIKTMLGWTINTVSMRVFLPTDKALAWSADITSLLKRNYVQTKELECIIGRLNHIGHILPTGRYFLNRLRHLLSRCLKYGKQAMQPWERQDLILWQKFINLVHTTGVHTNNLTFTKVTTILITDACEYGIGGYNAKTGFAWRYLLPLWMTKSCHINLLEFIASVVAIWLEMLNNQDIIQFQKFLALSDNSSTVGWLHKSNFNPKTHKGHDIVARQLATLLMETETTIESCHVKGEHNVVADSLSRDHHIHDSHLKFLLQSLFPSQVPQNFSIYSVLPIEITSWLDSLKGSMINSEVSPPKQFKSKMGALFDSKSSWKDVVSLTNSLTHSMRNPKSPSCRRLQLVLDEMKMAHKKN